MPLTDLTGMGYALRYCVCSSLVCHPSLVSLEQLVMSVKSLLQTCKRFVSVRQIKTRKKAAKSMTSDLFRLSRQKRCLFQIAKRSHSLRDWRNFCSIRSYCTEQFRKTKHASEVHPAWERSRWQPPMVEPRKKKTGRYTDTERTTPRFKWKWHCAFAWSS